jgi:putative hydrolase of HD superfamily
MADKMNNINIGFDEKLETQLNFVIEIDKVKNIIRKSKLFDGSRFENDAEHSWTICIMALLLKEYSNFPVNIEKVISMLLIHDIVEIDAGDTFLYAKNRNDAYINETKAAERIFGLLEKRHKNGNKKGRNINQNGGTAFNRSVCVSAPYGRSRVPFA